MPEVSAMKAVRPSPKIRDNNWTRMFGVREVGVYYALAIVVGAMAVAALYTGSANYLSYGNLTNVLQQSSLTAIMAIAMTVVLISGNFDLSVASVAALAAAVMVKLADPAGFAPACIVGMLVALGAGLMNGVIVELLGINAFIVTLGTMTALRGAVLIVTDARSVIVQEDGVRKAMLALETGRWPIGTALLAGGAVLAAVSVALAVRPCQSGRTVSGSLMGTAVAAVALLAVGWVGGPELALPKIVIYMLAFAAAVWAVLHFTVVGRRLYAVGANPEAARLSGVNVKLYKIAAFVLSSAAAGFAGILFASRLQSVSAASLTGAELTVIAAAILGGTSLLGGAGSVPKSVAGALLLFTLTNGFNILNLGVNYQGLIEGIVVVGAAAIYTVGGSKRL